MAAAPSFAVLVAFAAILATAVTADCSVDVDTLNMPSTQPVVVVSSSAQDFSSYLLPNPKGLLKVTQRQQVSVACPGSSFVFLPDAGDHVTAECEGNTTFIVDSVEYTFNGLLCTSNVKPTARYTSASCGVRGTFSVVEVGFTVGSEFHRLYDVCFSNKTLTTAYEHHTIPADINGAQKTSIQVDWDDGSFYGKIDISAAYSAQKDTISKILNKSVSDLFAEGQLERGALAPPADFMLDAQRVATFLGINSAPRWTQLDAGNWATLEDLLRIKVYQRSRDLEVYTGTLGVLALDNNDGVPTALYLMAPSGSKKPLPVPKYFWKIAYEPQTGLCAAFVTVNNPFATPEDLETHYRLCEDICEKIDWLTWEPSNMTGGLSYCCDYNEFKKNVPGIPVLDVKGYKESSSMVVAPAVWLTAALAAFTSSFAGV